MTHDTLNSNLKLLSSQFVQHSELGLHGLVVFFDEIRALSISAAEVHATMARFSSAIAVHIPYDVLQANFSATCGLCCHCQSPPAPMSAHQAYHLP